MSLKKFATAFTIIAAILCFADQAQAQFSLPKQGRATFSGQMVDAKSGTPLPDVQVTVRTEYEDLQTTTDSSGKFFLEVKDEKGLKRFLIIFSHHDYREKDLNGVINSLFGDKKARLTIQDNVANFKHRKTEASLVCNGSQDVKVENRIMHFAMDCQNDSRAVSLELSKGNTLSIKAKGNLEVEFDKEKARVIYAGDEPAQFEFNGVMYKR